MQLYRSSLVSIRGSVVFRDEHGASVLVVLYFLACVKLLFIFVSHMIQVAVLVVWSINQTLHQPFVRSFQVLARASGRVQLYGRTGTYIKEPVLVQPETLHPGSVSLEIGGVP